MSYKLIIADTSASVIKAVQIAFHEPEFEVYPFKDGAEVINNIAKIKPDAVVLNLSLQQIDGYEVCQTLKNHGQVMDIPLILLKRAFEVPNKKKLAALEYDEIIQEPFDSEKLACTVRKLIRAKKDPKTLPEEPLPEENSDFEFKVELDDNVKNLIKKEIFQVERELEKRIKARILADLKSSLGKK